jgi:alpha-L-rhamnosidase
LFERFFGHQAPVRGNFLTKSHFFDRPWAAEPVNLVYSILLKIYQDGSTMKISHLKTNRIINLLGFALGIPSFSWIVDETSDRKQTAAQVLVAGDPAFERILFDSGKLPGNAIDSLAYSPELILQPRTRYYWKVRVWGETEEAESCTSWFETSKMDEPWQAEWITPDFVNRESHPVMFKTIVLPSDVAQARAYICGLGLYHFELNGEKVGDEYLTPYCNAYDQWLQYQTYDITDNLKTGENLVSVMLGNGWYKGRYGMQEDPTNLKTYGEQFALISEMRVTLKNGEKMVFGTDETWSARHAPVLSGNIYDGEVFDARLNYQPALPDTTVGVKPVEIDMNKLQARRSLPVVVQEERKPVAVITTPAGETVLDMGQNMVGWVRFKTSAPAGSKIHLQFGEVLQNGNFYRDNLRTAKAEYIYIADGNEAVAQPYFTFFGFRYVKVTGWVGELNPDDFTGCVVYSQLDTIGNIETSNEKVNQLFRNALWGQKGNFLDIPTDCPQRDERLGWTGDTQVFSGTACFNMDSNAFFSKFGYDLAKEQAKFGGMVPYVIPVANMKGGGSSAWGDVATILPWNVYEFYGDKSILEQQFESMCAWVDFIKAADDATGGKRLWTSGFHFGDWLSLDGSDPNSPMGGTPEDFISSAYYFYSANLTARAATVLGKIEQAAHYSELAAEIKAAIQKEYFTPTGRLAIGTQTGFVLAQFMDLVPAEFQKRVIDDLVYRLRKDKLHLRTGFVGTPYICRVLSNHGANELAYRLLLNEDYPSWLYAVNLGATTIWERWNSLNPDGSISSTGMNSLNHYAYGAIVEWMYRDVCGLNPSSGDDQATGFRRARLAPKPDKALQWAKARYQSAAGLYTSGWQIGKQGNLTFEFTIPFNAEAHVVLPDAELGQITINGQKSAAGTQQGCDLVLQLEAGHYQIAYQPSRAYVKTFSTCTPIVQIVQNEQAKAILAGVFPMISMMDDNMLAAMGEANLREMASTPYLTMTGEQLDELDQLLGGITG